MTIGYFDTSASAKLYLDEPGRVEVRAHLAACERAVASEIAFTEVVSAVYRASRRNSNPITTDEAQRLDSRIQADFRERFDLERVTSEVIDKAASLVARHPIRAFDAIHLATAIAVRDLIGPDVLFLTSDARLRLAALAEGFTVPDIPSA